VLAMIIGYIRRQGHLSEDGAIGIGYVAAMVLAQFSWVCAPRYLRCMRLPLWQYPGADGA
jgi:hypothetical protein